MPNPEPRRMDRIVNLCKRRGFVFPSAEIYGGLGGFWDWGPLGVLLKNNIKREWWKTFVQQRDDVVGIDGSIITNPKVWEASGHVKNFHDFAIECKKCNQRFKVEDIVPETIQQEIIEKHSEVIGRVDKGQIDGEGANTLLAKVNFGFVPAINKTTKCPNCNSSNWSQPGYLDQMFQTFVGAARHTGNMAYLRPETAQNIFANYELVRDSMRMKLPFGIAQIGKAFRNEITPGNFVFRSREFEQMELEYFVVPRTDDEWFEKWVKACEQWFIGLGVKKSSMRLRKQGKDELAHYAKATTDIEFSFPIEKGWSELMGIANRTDFDLKQHGKFAKGDELAFATPVDDDGKIKKVPYVIEPSMGVDRAALAFLLDAYEVVQGGRTTTTDSIKEEEIVLRLDPKLAPYTAAVLPLSKKAELQRVSREVAATLRREFSVAYDETGSIGKRYRRQDEIGTPWCVTVDFDTLDGGKRPKGTVTVRDRDSMTQEDVAIGDLSGYIREKFA